MVGFVTGMYFANYTIWARQLPDCVRDTGDIDWFLMSVFTVYCYI